MYKSLAQQMDYETVGTTYIYHDILLERAAHGGNYY